MLHTIIEPQKNQTLNSLPITVGELTVNILTGSDNNKESIRRSLLNLKDLFEKGNNSELFPIQEGKLKTITTSLLSDPDNLNFYNELLKEQDDVLRVVSSNTDNAVKFLKDLLKVINDVNGSYSSDRGSLTSNMFKSFHVAI